MGNTKPSPFPYSSLGNQDYGFNEDAGADKYLDWVMESSTEPPLLMYWGEAGSGEIKLFLQPPCLS